MPGKVFLGLNNTAGVCTRLKKGFREINVDADFYSFSKHIFGYSSDKIISYSNTRLIRVFQKALLFAKLILKYKYFIFDSASTLLPDYKDIKLLKKFGKKTMMVFTGCDVRFPEEVEKFRWNPCRDCDDNYKSFVGCVIERKKKYVRKIEEVFDIIVCPKEASGFLKRNFESAYFPVNLEMFPAEKYSNYTYSKKLRILHAPSNELYKGSKYIYEAINKLKNEFDFEFKTVKNISIEKLYEEINNSDLIIDQMLTGIYGLFSIESMAMFKPVVCYVRDDSLEPIKSDCPIFNANPDTLYDVLKNILKFPDQLKDAAKRSREFVEKYHDAGKIAKKYYDLFEGVK